MAMLNGNYREYKLENGLVVALQNTMARTIAGRLRINYGAVYEQSGEEGLAHFLEHCLVTGGSKKYTPAQADEMRNSFPYSNAFTNHGRIFPVSDILPEDFENWLDYISDCVFNPRFDGERVNAERKRVLREIADAKSNLAYPRNQEFNSLLYRGHTKQKFVLGNEEVVRNADIEKLREFHSRGFYPANMDLIFAGAIPENAETLIEKYFGSYPAGKDLRMKFPKLATLTQQHIIYRAAKEKLNTDNPANSTASITLGFIVPDKTSDDWNSIAFMSTLLGGCTNSRLFKNLSLERGLVYGVHTQHDGNYNAGELCVYANVPVQGIDEATSAIFDEFNRLKTERVSEAEMRKIKKLARYSLAKIFDSNDGHVHAIETKLDDDITQEEIMAEFDKVDSDALLRTSNLYLLDRTGNYILYVLNPLLEEKIE